MINSLRQNAIYVVIALLIILTLAGFVYDLSNGENNSNLNPVLPRKTKPVKPNEPMPSPDVTEVSCTLEAKLCPDGSAVGRVGPDCEFAPCP